MAMGSSCAFLYLALVFIGSVLATQERKKWTAVMIHCKDVGHQCGMLANAGYCVLVPSYMSKLCMRTCRLCGRQQTYGNWKVHMQYRDNPQ